MYFCLSVLANVSKSFSILNSARVPEAVGVGVKVKPLQSNSSSDVVRDTLLKL